MIIRFSEWAAFWMEYKLKGSSVVVVVMRRGEKYMQMNDRMGEKLNYHLNEFASKTHAILRI